MGALGAHAVLTGFYVRVLHAALHLQRDVAVDAAPGLRCGRVVTGPQHLAEAVVQGRPQALHTGRSSRHDGGGGGGGGDDDNINDCNNNKNNSYYNEHDDENLFLIA